ncbi:aspartate 1-decarboxylase [Planctomicrobium sp. SH527]|uniref:aspartate 1-decarboxylase n=1 Tax=Planctomicrobium sp. SH527 TaxID=3448123 RepID=UPI003F5BCC2E
MLLRLLKAKLHMAAVTQTELDYHGSVTIDRDLMDAVGLLPYEQVMIANCSNGTRGETYVLEGERGSGQIQMNGALARLAHRGDRIIIMAFVFATKEEAAAHHPKVAILNEKNVITEQFQADIA